MTGVTDDENILAAFSRASFLNMWTWPNLFRDQGKTSESSDGKEICDLTVIFGNTIIIFSDKRVRYNSEKSKDIAWCRWARKAIGDSVKQLEGAERWLRTNANRIFTDKKCEVPIAINLPDAANMKIVPVIVTHGLERVICNAESEGSLSFTNRLIGEQNWVLGTAEPFVIGNPSESFFVHVFTEATIALVLSIFDTAKDFTAYLDQREALLSILKPVDIFKESDIIHLFYENYQDESQARLVLSAPELRANSVRISKPPFHELYSNPSFQYKKREDAISYLWDQLIDVFALHAMNGTSEFRNWDTTSEIEPALRVMANPGRFERRVLSHEFLDFYYKVQPGQRGTRVIFCPSDPSTGYLFLMFPDLAQGANLNSYRKLRRQLLEDYCFIVAGQHPELTSLVGLAAQTRDSDRPLTPNFFEEGQDFIFLDCSERTPEQQGISDEIMAAYQECGLLKSRTRVEGVINEFSD